MKRLLLVLLLVPFALADDCFPGSGYEVCVSDATPTPGSTITFTATSGSGLESSEETYEDEWEMVECTLLREQHPVFSYRTSWGPFSADGLPVYACGETPERSAYFGTADDERSTHTWSTRVPEVTGVYTITVTRAAYFTESQAPGSFCGGICPSAQVLGGSDLPVQLRVAEPTDETNGSAGALTDTGQTNIIAAAGKVHVCGTQWNVSAGQGMTQTHGFCEEVRLATGLTFTCSIADGQWKWMNAASRITNAPDDENYVALREHWTAPPGLTWPIICDQGMWQSTVKKYTPPPARSSGSCANSQCYAGKDPAGNEQCRKAGETATSSAGVIYTCAIVDEETKEAQWRSPAVPLAEAMLEHVGSGDFVLNCGPAETAINSVGDAAHRYCQLAKISGGEASEILVGVAFDNQTDISPAFEKQVQKVHPDYIQADGTDYVEYNGTAGIAYFTSRSSLSGSAWRQLWTRLTSMFDTDRDVQLRTKSGDRIHMLRKGGSITEHAAEYVSAEDCVSGASIIGPSTQECFTEAGWRKVMQAR